ncbi:efflux RND transporter permease subunit [Sediminibacterium sp.]|uniref:efflux RND transporter permease subunit n=1 Tax=Sediminibacterium sp. TaxID=1917865 RepID=UPI003F6A34DD
MNFIEGVAKKFKEFKPTSWAIDNRTAVYVITILISLYGLNKFTTLPKEQFPDIVVPTISITTVYFGNSPKDIENLVTRPIEKQLKGISGAKVNKIQSTSQQDYSLIVVEFDTDIKPEIAKIKVKDAVDKAQTDLPNDLTSLPNVQEFSISDQPIMFVNLSGDFDGVKLKEYADKLQDRFEELKEVNRAEIVGAPEREIQINIDPAKLAAAKLTFRDIESAVNLENKDISGGLVEVGTMKRNIKIKGQFKTAFDMQHIQVKNVNGAPIYLQDVAQIIDTVKETESYARLDGKNVITINIVKRAGENLINTADGINKIVAEMQESEELPKNLKVVITGDQSKGTKTSFNELVNTIIIGFILVLVILMFFMGVTNAFFVALSVPLSVFVSFMFLPLGEFIAGGTITLNFIVLFALLFGLGIIVDDAIVVIENTHRIYQNGKVKIVRSAKEAAGEVFIPVLAGTATTLAPFFPLLLWKGIIGKFMIYLPIMLILTLAASLVVAFFINPVFAVSFMKPEGREYESPKNAIFKQWWFWGSIILGVLFNLVGWHGFGNFLIFMALLVILERYVLRGIIHFFQERALPGLMNRYEKLLQYILVRKRPVYLLIGLFVLFPISLFLLILRDNPKPFFPSGDPKFVYVYLKMPIGTKAQTTDSVLRVLESRVYKILGNDQPGKEGSIVESVISNVAVGANNPRDNNRSTQSHLGRIQVSFVEFEQRHGKSSAPFQDEIRKQMVGIPGASIEVRQEDAGPPTEPPVNIEVSGDNFDALAKTAIQLLNHLDTNRVEGMQSLGMDIDLNNPEITVNIDRQRALSEGVSTAQIGSELRTAVFGKEVSKLKDDEDEYKIQLRFDAKSRNDINELMNMRIVFRDFTTGAIKQIPLSSVATIEYTNTAGGVKRKNLKRTIQIQSAVTDPSLTPEINKALAKKIEEFKAKTQIPADITIKQTGEGEQQAETSAFLGTALLSALLIIFLILVLQFNSLSKPFIVLTEIFFSIIGVFLGYALTGMSMATIMVGVGIIGLAGIVIKNGILLIEFTDELRGRGYKTRAAAIEAGKIRIIPVLLTALATMMGMFPLAIGFNIDFVSMFTHLDPKIFIGGDSVVFWGPLAWTIIFGLIFSFFLTLIMVPSMYLISERLRRPMERFYGTKYVALFGFTGPLFFIFVGIMFGVKKLQGKKVWMGEQKINLAKN